MNKNDPNNICEGCIHKEVCSHIPDYSTLLNGVEEVVSSIKGPFYTKVYCSHYTSITPRSKELIRIREPISNGG